MKKRPRLLIPLVAVLAVLVLLVGFYIWKAVERERNTNIFLFFDQQEQQISSAQKPLPYHYLSVTRNYNVLDTDATKRYQSTTFVSKPEELTRVTDLLQAQQQKVASRTTLSDSRQQDLDKRFELQTAVYENGVMVSFDGSAIWIADNWILFENHELYSLSESFPLDELDALLQEIDPQFNLP